MDSNQILTTGVASGNVCVLPATKLKAEKAGFLVKKVRSFTASAFFFFSFFPIFLPHDF